MTLLIDKRRVPQDSISGGGQAIYLPLQPRKHKAAIVQLKDIYIYQWPILIFLFVFSYLFNLRANLPKIFFYITYFHFQSVTSLLNAQDSDGH